MAAAVQPEPVARPRSAAVSTDLAYPGSVPPTPVTTWGAELEGPPTLHDLARRLGGHRWVEERAFELLGGWASAVPEPEVKALFASHSYHHAWHAELLADCLPELAAVGTRQSLAVAPGPRVEAFFEGLADAGGGTLDKLVGVYRVLLPAVIGAYRRDLSAMNPVSDAPAIRALELVLRDELFDQREGELVVGSPAGSAGSRAGWRQAEFERLLTPDGQSSA